MEYRKVKRDNKFMEIVRGIRFKKYLEEAEKEKKELNESYEESKRQTKERTTSEKPEEKKVKDNE